jgi:hypothetical protein
MMDRPLEIRDFSGGITDNHIDSALNKYEEADNFNIEIIGGQGKLVRRLGGSRYSNAEYIGSTANRIMNLKDWGVQDIVTAVVANSGSDTVRFHRRNGFTSWIEEGTATTLRKPTTTSLLNGNWYNAVSITQWYNHVLCSIDTYTQEPIKMFKNGSNVECVTAGLPKPTRPSNANPPATPGVNTFLYVLVYKYTYTVDGTTFIDRSAPSTITNLGNVADPPNATFDLSASILANTSTTNYDATNVVRELYRTAANGTVFYKVAEVNNAATSYLDTMADATLITRELLYTMDGSVENDPPPFAKYIHATDLVTLYANVKAKDDNTIYANRVYQSVPNDPDSVPYSFFAEVQEPINGVSSYRGLPLVFCQDAVYRLEGVIDQFGRGEMFPVRISSTAGCISNNSIVQTKDGVFWCGNDGIYWTDGYNIKNVTGNDLRVRYLGWFRTAANNTDIEIKGKRAQGKFSEAENRIFWIIPGAITDAVTVAQNKLLVLHMDAGNAFTTWSNLTHFSPTAIEIFNKVPNGKCLMQASQRSVFQMTNDFSADMYIDYSVYTIPEKYIYIPYSFKSTTTSFGDNYTRKFNTRLVTVAKAKGGLTMLPTSNADFGRIVAPLKLIANELSDSTYTLVEEQRRFPGNTLRCSYRQIYLQPANVQVDVGYTGAMLSDGVKAVEFPSVSYTWPTEPVGMVLYFNGNLNTAYTIYKRNTAQQVWVTPAPPANGGITSFVLKGYPTNEEFTLMALSIHWEPLGRTQDGYTAASEGGAHSI